MKYFLVDEKLNKYVEVDETTDKSRVFVKGELEKEVAEAQARLSKIPAPMPDSELLLWAKANYPQMNYGVEKASLEDLVSKNTAVISAIGGK